MTSNSMNIGFVSRVCIVAALGGLLFGFDTAIISGAIPFIQSYFNLNAVWLGWAVSCVLIGCAVGAMVAGKLADIFGRRFMLITCALLFAVSGIGAGLAGNLWTFISYRMLGGLGVGAAAMVSPMYIAEIAPAAIRGRMVALYQLAIVSGILLAYGAGYAFADIVPNNWRWMFASQALPALLFFIPLCFVPETPRWLVGKNKISRAKAVLGKISGIYSIDAEIHLIQSSFESGNQGTFSEIFRRPYAKVLFCGIMIAVFQQVCGVNAILYYAPTIFKATGLGHADALFQTILMGAVNVLATIIAIVYVDKIGRKTFLITGSLLMGLCLVVVATCFHFNYFGHYVVLIATLAYVATFACTLGAVTWVYLSEIFPNRIRGMALSIATLALWLADFVVSYTFPVMTGGLGTPLTLTCYTVCCFLAFFFMYRLPETKGRTLETMEIIFINQKNNRV